MSSFCSSSGITFIPACKTNQNASNVANMDSWIENFENNFEKKNENNFDKKNENNFDKNKTFKFQVFNYAKTDEWMAY